MELRCEADPDPRNVEFLRMQLYEYNQARTLEGYPRGHRKHFLRKALRAA